MPKHKIDATFTYGLSGEREFSLTVEYTYHRAYRDPLRETPPEDAHVTIHRVTGRRWGFDTKTGRHIEVGDEIDFTEIVCVEDLADEVLREHEGEIQAARENAMEDRYSDMREAAQ